MTHVPDRILASLEAAKTYDDLVRCLVGALTVNNMGYREVVKSDDYLAITDSLSEGSDLPAIAFETMLDKARIEEPTPWIEAYQRISVLRHASAQQVYIGGENAQVSVNNYTIPSDAAIRELWTSGLFVSHEETPAPEDPRDRHYFRYLGQSLMQSMVTFILFTLVATVGMTIVLIGAALAVIHGNANASTTAPILTTIAGVVVSTCAGAIAVQAHKARKNAADEAAHVRQDIKDDKAFDRATTAIGKVNDPALRNRLFAVSAVKELGVSPDPIDLDRLLSMEPKAAKPVEGSEKKELESGD